MDLSIESPLPHAQPDLPDRAALLVFTLEEQRYGLPLPVIERVVPAVAVTPVWNAPAMVLGVINLQGRVVPVFSGRKWFGLPERAIRLSDRLIIVQLAEQKLALLVDQVIGVVPRTEEVRGDALLPGLDSFASVVKGSDGLILLPQLEKLFQPLDSFSFNETGANGIN